MNLAIFIFLIVLLMNIAVTFKKELSLFEIFFIWMIVWLITHSLSSILIENLELISVSHKLPNFWLHVLKRLLLYPLITIHFIDYFLRYNSKLFRSLIFTLNIIVMILLEFLFINLGVLINLNYSVWISLIEWSFTLGLTYVTWLWYRKKYIEVTT